MATKQPIGGSGSRNEGNETHEWSWWKDDVADNLKFYESYNVDSKGNVTNYHTGIVDEKTGQGVAINEHTGEQFDTGPKR